jgi:hypothetical protein
MVRAGFISETEGMDIDCLNADMTTSTGPHPLTPTESSPKPRAPYKHGVFTPPTIFATVNDDPDKDIFTYPISNTFPRQLVLVDLTWSLDHMPDSLQLASFPLRHLHNNSLHNSIIRADVLTSTPSDWTNILLKPGFVPPQDMHAYALTSLRQFGLETEAVVKTVLSFLHTGRFNSAAFNDGEYTFDRSVSLLSLASRYAMSRLVQIILMEMSREFLGQPVTDLDTRQQQAQLNATFYSGQDSIDLTAAQLDQISRIYHRRVAEWIHAYLIPLFSTPAGDRITAKAAVEDCIVSQAAWGGGASMLQRIVMLWFNKNPNPRRGKRVGELAKLRAIKGEQKRLRSTSMLSIAASSRTVGTTPISRLRKGGLQGSIRGKNEMTWTPSSTPAPSVVRTLDLNTMTPTHLPVQTVESQDKRVSSPHGSLSMKLIKLKFRRINGIWIAVSPEAKETLIPSIPSAETKEQDNRGENSETVLIADGRKSQDSELNPSGTVRDACVAVKQEEENGNMEDDDEWPGYDDDWLEDLKRQKEKKSKLHWLLLDKGPL